MHSVVLFFANQYMRIFFKLRLDVALEAEGSLTFLTIFLYTNQYNGFIVRRTMHVLYYI